MKHIPPSILVSHNFNSKVTGTFVFYSICSENGRDFDDYLSVEIEKGLAAPQLLVMELLRTVSYITSPS